MSIKSKLIEKYSNYGEFFLVTPNSTVIVFGKSEKHEDLVIRTNLNINQKSYQLFNLDGLVNVTETEVMNLFNKVITKIKSIPTESFNLDKKYVEAIGDTINTTDSTHIRFFTENTNLKVTVFNYRQFISKISIRENQTPFISESIIKNSYFSGEINFTLDARTFLKLPDNNYNVEILENGLINFINLESEIEFFLREQEIQEPITKFINEKSEREIVFLFQPTIT
jgi:CRISPR/Cas system CSM-associated protein Csm3 (group 7 of RAMP superfamily)